MDPELQALREARLAELKRGTQGPSSGGESGKGAGSNGLETVIAAYLQPQALERLSRVSLVRPDRAQAVEQYLAKMVSQGALSHKVTEDEIVQILHGVAREQNKKMTPRSYSIDERWLFMISCPARMVMTTRMISLTSRDPRLYAHILYPKACCIYQASGRHLY
ncbi:Sdd2p TDEL_0A03120 [Torulaspora delbrueckii]|uniref:Uncharacterized protein n=1 Tax=Torulaspora delbrueckii TaxID=4950 RepID=G8ZM00_TORDE|nr:hypothetical protein TDEL_0A03120 [Torulaspora delbrueckii]CCE89644.1 hypothetical protein TDEL_0A03120 [Torulaspora delbrueckii]